MHGNAVARGRLVQSGVVWVRAPHFRNLSLRPGDLVLIGVLVRVYLGGVNSGSGALIRINHGPLRLNSEIRARTTKLCFAVDGAALAPSRQRPPLRNSYCATHMQLS
jgi:hypothetical protein